MKIDFDNFSVLTFDCYGTLIDWEKGVIESLASILSNYGVNIADDTLLELYGELEVIAESRQYHDYRTVLKMVLQGFGLKLKFEPNQAELNSFSGSVKDWPAFPDSPSALQMLKKKYKLAVISNIDDDLFAFSAQRLQVGFDWVITAQQAKSYKPAINNFNLALKQIGMPVNKILHVAQSLYHDIVPAKKLGLSTVWVNRRHNKTGFGATKPAQVQPELEVPDLQTLAQMII